MDWERIRQCQRQALLRFLALLSARLGVQPGETRGPVPKATYWAALALLRPLESAVRRLVAIHAAGLEAPAPAVQPRPKPSRRGPATADARRPPLFRLWDRRKQFEPPAFRNPRHPPRITLLGIDDWVPYPQPEKRDPDAPRDAALLCRRLWAIDRALSDPDAQALRLARWKARRAAMRAAGRKAKFLHPLRPGSPPGYRRHRQRPIDRTVQELDVLARQAEAGIRSARTERGAT